MPRRSKSHTPPPVPESLARVKEVNMDTIYRKQDAGSLAVSAPTEEMVKGGTETRLFITVTIIFACFLSPAILLLSTCALGVSQRDYWRAGGSLLALGLLIWPIYVTTRYSPTRAGRIMVFLRGTLAPVLIGLVLQPSAAGPAQQFRALLGMLVLAAGLSVLRKRCEGPDPVNGKLRVLLIGDSFPPKVDGVATFANNSAKYLRRFGHEVEVVTSLPGPAHFWGAPVTRLPGMSTPISPGHSISLPLPTVLLTFMRFRPHIIHLLEVSPLNLAVFVYAQFADIPVTFSSHTRLDLYVNLVSPGAGQLLNSLILFSLERALYPLCDGHMTVCELLLKKVQARGCHNVRLWSSGADEGFDRNKHSAETRARLSGGRPDLPLVLHVGRLGPEKNSDEIGLVLRELNALMEVRLAIVGDGKSREVIEKEHLPNVYFAGFLTGLPLQQAYASADVFFSPSTSEGFPLVFIEAMASGLAVVGPIAGGVPDVFEQGVHGELYEPHDCKQAALAVKRAIQAGEPMRQRAYEHGKSFSWEKAGRELESLLLHIVELKRRAKRWE